MTDLAVDVAIVGGGVAGLLTAWRMPTSVDVALLERASAPGSAATGAAFGNLSVAYGSGAAAKATRKSLAFYLNPPKDISVEPLIVRRGEILVTPRSKAAKANDYYSLGVRLTPKEAADRSPLIDPGRITDACWIEESYDLYPSKLVVGLCSALSRRKSTHLFFNTQVTSIERRRQNWILRGPDFELRAEIIVNAAGAHADRVAALAGIQPLGLIPRRRTVSIFDAETSPAASTGPLVASFDDKPYFRPSVGEIWVSPGEARKSLQGFGYGTATSSDSEQAKVLFSTISNVRLGRLLRSWSGLRTISPDQQACVGGSHGFVWFAGLAGQGLQAGPAFSEIAVAAVMGRLSRLGDLADLIKPDRFHR